MILHSEAISLLHKWRDAETSLRFDGESSLYSFSVTGVVESETDSILKFRIPNSGFIAVHLPPDTRFEYGDPDSMRIDPAERMSRDHNDEPIKTASGLVPCKSSKEKFLFLEIV
jgi:hypothetical protein